MIDFLSPAIRLNKTKGREEVYPKFLVRKSSDLMIRGSDFYAIWDEQKGLWSTDEQEAIVLIDQELDAFAKANNLNTVAHLYDSETGMIDRWHKYCQKQMPDSYHELDDKLIFLNDKTKREDYASKRLNYSMNNNATPGYDILMSTLYADEERRKIEWAIGAIISGDSKIIQKFLVLYGAAGTGKSTVLNIIQQLFEGYYSVFDAKALGSNNNSFALESFKSNPLVSIQHDGDLSKIEDNTKLNSIVSHELMTVNEKFKSAYSTKFRSFILMGTNKPVRITDGKSGLMRRLIDVSPSGKKLGVQDYKNAVSKIPFELGGIAKHCLDIYNADPGFYDDYVPIAMLSASNDFYNFVVDSYHVFKRDNGTSLKAAWEMYKTYCDEAKVPYPYSQKNFKEELKNYFWDYSDRFEQDDGSRIRSYYSDFRVDIFEAPKKKTRKPKNETVQLLELNSTKSLLDAEYADCPAQYANNGVPSKKWSNVVTTLKDIDTSKEHYVKIPENHIVIDFDIPNANGEKWLEKNLEEAKKWPKTYAELSKSGFGVHLHYIYDGDASKLSNIYDDHIEIKVFKGDSALRRRVTKCNDIPIATINSGLPIKKEKKMVNNDVVQTEKGLRTTIKKCLNKEIHSSTKSNIDFIYEILKQAYEKGVTYDVSDMKNEVVSFAMNSTNQSTYCLKLIKEMKFKSEDTYDRVADDNSKPIVFFDIEVFPNLFLLNWKFRGKENPVVRCINPDSKTIENLLQYRLIGFNCRRYDNHILYARLMGYDNKQLFELSTKIVEGGKTSGSFFSEAYNLSYTDIYDFASAGNKKSLKKLEIEMRMDKNFDGGKTIKHKELGIPWDKPVPEEWWERVAEYCDNDVIATEAAFDYLSADWTARQILADITGMTVNDTTNTLTTKFIFEKNRNPQDQFNYRNLAEPVYDLNPDTYEFLKVACPEMMATKHGKKKSLLPYFDGYSYNYGVSTYRGEEVGEGGYVYAEPGIYTNVALLDIASMHPHSIISECLFGANYTSRFRDIVNGRVEIKHENWPVVNKMFGGKLAPYVKKVENGEMKSKDLANALKTAINSVYGLTSASFPNAFNDKRNIDNIVAKRGALFMIDLKHEIQERGFTVAHIKTDSIKIPNATPEIIQFVMDFGKKYGYTFEHEDTYERMCLINDAVYIAYSNGEWHATGKQFAVPYVFKTLFSKEPIEFSDYCETFSVTKGYLYLDYNEKLPDVSDYEKIRDIRKLTKLTKSQQALLDSTIDISEEDLQKKIDEGHSLQFVGRTGLFTPVKENTGGGLLYRVANGKNYAAPGSSGFRWLESEMVNDESIIDKNYYYKLVDAAVDIIKTFGDYDWFIDIDDKPPWD